jgi:hypothetical protein
VAAARRLASESGHALIRQQLGDKDTLTATPRIVLTAPVNAAPARSFPGHDGTAAEGCRVEEESKIRAGERRRAVESEREDLASYFEALEALLNLRRISGQNSRTSMKTVS